MVRTGFLGRRNCATERRDKRGPPEGRSYCASLFANREPYGLLHVVHHAIYEVPAWVTATDAYFESRLEIDLFRDTS